MFITYQELVVMTLCAAITFATVVLLLTANYQLLKQNRFLRSRLRSWRYNCQSTHVEKPWR